MKIFIYIYNLRQTAHIAIDEPLDIENSIAICHR